MYDVTVTITIIITIIIITLVKVLTEHSNSEHDVPRPEHRPPAGSPLCPGNLLSGKLQS